VEVELVPGDSSSTLDRPLILERRLLPRTLSKGVAAARLLRMRADRGLSVSVECVALAKRRETPLFRLAAVEPPLVRTLDGWITIAGGLGGVWICPGLPGCLKIGVCFQNTECSGGLNYRGGAEVIK
jgi:hypothetical protein